MSKVSVLVVDDAPFIRDLVKKALRSQFPGIRTEDAVNGRKAQQMLARERFDLILCDWEMPEMSGLELLTWCRTQDALKAVPFIMVTSRGDKENVVQAIQAGVSDFIGKPFSNEQLTSKVRKALGRAGKLDALAASAPTRVLSTGVANDSLAALTGGKAEVVRPAAAPAPEAKAAPLIQPSSAAPAAAPECRLVRARPRPAAAGPWQRCLCDQGAEPQGGAAGGQAWRVAAAGAGKCRARPGAGRGRRDRAAQRLSACRRGVRAETRQRLAAARSASSIAIRRSSTTCRA